MNRTCESVKKLLPFKVIAGPELPAPTLVGDMLRIKGRFDEL